MRRLQTRQILAGLALAACSAISTPNNVPIVVPLDLNAAVLQAGLADINRFGAVTTMLGVASTVPFPAFDTSQCTFNTIDDGFECAPVELNGLVYTLKYFVYDSLGIALPSVDPLRAASLRTLTRVRGSTATGTLAAGAVATIDHQSDVITTGLRTPIRVLNGTTRDRDLVTTTGTPNILLAIDLTGTAVNIVMTSPLDRFPATGTITSVSTTTTAIDILPQVITTASAVLTFNGTDVATVVVRKAGEVSTCRIAVAGGTTATCVTTP